MSEISVIWSGDGIAYVDEYFPSDGDTVTLSCFPDNHCTLIDIEARDSHGYAVALLVTEVQQFVYNAALGNILINVTFSDMPFIYKNLWLLNTRKWWRKNNF